MSGQTRFRDLPRSAYPFTVQVFHACASSWHRPVWSATVSAPGALPVPGWPFPVRVETRLASGELSQAWSTGPPVSVAQVVWWCRRLLRHGGDAVKARMYAPQPGDLVVEWTSWRRYDPDGIGRLLRVEGQRYVDDRWVVEPLERPGQEQGWRNADFLAVPGIPGWPPGEVVWDAGL